MPPHTTFEAHLDNDINDIGRIVDAKYAADNAISSIRRNSDIVFLVV